MQPKVLRQLFIVEELASVASPSGSAHWADQAEGEAAWRDWVGKKGSRTNTLSPPQK